VRGYVSLCASEGAHKLELHVISRAVICCALPAGQTSECRLTTRSMGLTASRTRAGQPTASTSDVDSTGGNTAAQARRRAKGGSPTPPTPARHGGPPGGSDVSLSARAEGAAKAVVATTGVWRPFNFAKKKADQQVSKFTKSKYFQQSVRTRPRSTLLTHLR
jgi:hypothetical protein